MAYKLLLTPIAEKDMSKLDRSVAKAIQARLMRLAESAEEIHSLGLIGQYVGLHKLRVHGKYRALYRLSAEPDLSLSSVLAIEMTFIKSDIVYARPTAV